MANIDNRLMRVGIEVSGRMRFYDQLAITATGVKFGNPNQGEAQISITNLEGTVRDFILTETSPLNRNQTPKRITLEVGRESTGSEPVVCREHISKQHHPTTRPGVNHKMSDWSVYERANRRPIVSRIGEPFPDSWTSGGG